MISVAEILTHIRPDCEWVLVGEPTNEQEYLSSLTWNSAGEPPTWGELTGSSAEVEQIRVEELRTRENTRVSALAKLTALGLTEGEAKAVIGLN